MIKKRSIIIILLFTAFIQAQEQRSFSLEEAISFALDSSYTAVNSRKDVAKAIKRRWETVASGLPQRNFCSGSFWNQSKCKYYSDIKSAHI